ncbi:MAG: hypothetical protein H6656_00945 [Ardenticatenaceae bacterium]|nr:hypothetical protein [Ardenticatenaceae bacterium]
MSVTHHQLLVVGLGLLLACVLEANASRLDYGATGGDFSNDGSIHNGTLAWKMGERKVQATSGNRTKGWARQT